MTDFDTTTYPLETSTRFRPDLGTEIDQLDDGTYQLRVLTTLRPIVISCMFTPQSETVSGAFETYLYDNCATLLDIVHNGKTYRGYIDGKTVDKSVSDGTTHWWSFEFKAESV